MQGRHRESRSLGWWHSCNGMIKVTYGSKLDPVMITPKTYRLEELPVAMKAAEAAGNLKAVVI